MFSIWRPFFKILKTQKNQQPCAVSHRKPHSLNFTPNLNYPNPNIKLNRTPNLNFEPSLKPTFHPSLIGRFSTWRFLPREQAKTNVIGWRCRQCLSPANQVAFFSVRANKFAKWKTGFSQKPYKHVCKTACQVRLKML